MEEQQWRNEFVALDAPPTVQTSTTQPAPVKPPRRRIPWKWVIIVIAFVVSLIVGLLLLRSVVGKKSSASNTGNTTKSQDVDLGSLSDVATPLKVDNTDKVVINGVLETNQGLVINPTGQPATAILGQLYVDSGTRELRFYNGEGYQTVATTGSTLSTQDVLNLIGANALTLPQDLSKTASPQFTGMTLTSVLKIGGTILQASSGGSSTFTLPSNTGSANQCLTTDGAGTLSFASCASGSGNAFLQGGNAFATAANLGTTDANSLSFLTNNTARMTITATGNIGINNASSDNKLAINVPTTVDNAAQLLVATDSSTNKGLVIQGEFAQTGSLIEAQDYNGSALFTVGGNGVSAFRTGTNSTTGFQVQNASGTSVLNVDTTNQRIGIGYSNPSYKLDVNGDVNIVGTSALRIGGAVICTASGCAASGSSGFYIQNSTGVQSNANFAIQSANAGYVAGLIRGAAGQTANLLNLQVSNGTNVLAVGATGSVLAQNSSNSTTAFQIQDAAGTSNVFIADTVNNRIGIGIVPSYKLDINGDANIEASSALRIGGTVICTIDGCVGTSSSANNFIQNTTGTQSNANFSIQSANSTYVGGVIKGAVGQTADLLNLRNSAGANLFGVSATGALTLQNSTDSTSALSVNDAAGTSHVLVVDTVNKRVGINEYPTGYALDVNGDVNLDNSGSLRINGNVVCSLSGCSASSGSGNYIQNGNGIQTNGNFAIQSANIGYVGGLIRGASGQTADLFQVQNSSASNMFRIGATGAVTLQNSADSTAAFNINNSGGTTIFNVDTQGGTTNATNLNGNAIIGTTSNSSSYGVIGTQYAGVGGGVKGVGGGGYGVFGQSASNASGFFQTTDTTNLNTVATLITKAQTNQSTANIFEAQNSSGTSVLGISATGAVLAKNSTDSATAFQIQNAAGNNYLLVNTSGAAVSLGNTGIASTIQIGNTTGAVAQTVNIGNNTTASSSTTVNLGSSIGASPTTIKAGTSGVLVQTANSTTAFQIQNAASAELFKVDSTNTVIRINGSNTGELQSWGATTGNLSLSLKGQTTVTTGGYIYNIGGIRSGTVITGGVDYAQISATGNIGSWSSTTQLVSGSSEVPRAYHATATYGGFIYVVGGYDNTNTVSTSVFYNRINADGTLGSTWTQAENKLSTGLGGGSAVAINGYLYILGGGSSLSAAISSGGTPSGVVSTANIQYAKINADGSIGAFNSTTTTMPDPDGAGPLTSGFVGGRAITANGYIYYVGGQDSSLTARNTVYYVRPSTTGDITSSWTQANSLTNSRAYHGVAVQNGYLYAYGGGANATTASGTGTIEYADFGTNGALSTWTTAANNLSTSTTNFGYASTNGYIYAIAGSNSSGTSLTTSQYVSGARVYASSLDLVGLGGDALASGGTGGTLTAGNTTIAGRLLVGDTATFLQNASIMGSLSVGGQAAFKNDTDSTNAFSVQNASGSSVLVIDTSSALINPGFTSSTTTQARTITQTSTQGAADLTTTATTMALGGDGKPIITALDSTNNKFVTQKCLDAACVTGVTQVTHSSPISSTDSYGTHNSVAISKIDGLPIIGVRDNTANRLTAIKCGSHDCSSGNRYISTATTNTGQEVKTIVSSDGIPLFFYKNGGTADIAVMQCTTTACTALGSERKLSDADSVGTGLTGALGVDDKPILAYQDTTGTDTVKVTKCPDTTCSTWTGSTTYTLSYGANNLGDHIALSVPSDGRPVIAAQDTTSVNNDILIFKCSNSSCSSYLSPINISSVTGQQLSTSSLSMAIGPDDLPIVTFKRASVPTMYVVKCGNATCSSGNVTTTIVGYSGAGSYGAVSNITVGNDGFPIIASSAGGSNQTNVGKNLSVTHCVDLTCGVLTASVRGGGVNLGSKALPYSGVYTDTINEGRDPSVAPLRVTSDRTIYANALTASSDGVVKVASTASTAFLVQNSDTGTKLFNVDASANRVNIMSTLSSMSAPTSLAVGSATSGGSLTASSFYWYKVTAIDSMGGETGASNEAVGLTGAAGTQTLPLTWTAVTGATGYKVYRSAANGGSNTEVYLTTVLTNSYSDGGSVTAGTATAPSTGSAYTAANQLDKLGALTIGGYGTPTGQLYVSGIIPSSTTGSVTAGTIPTYVAVQGRYAYVVNQTSATLQVIDINNKENPVITGSVSTGTAPRAVVVQGRYAYVVNQTSNTLQVIDVSNPASPTSVSTVTTGLAPLALQVRGRYAFVLNGTSSTFQIFDISNASGPVSVGVVATGTLPRSISVQGNYAYITNFTSGSLQVINIANVASPSVVGTVTTNLSGPRQIVVQGRYAYVANSNGNNLLVFDVSNPASPVYVSGLTVGTVPYGLAVQGRYAYVTNFSSSPGNFQTVDISNPAQPFSVGTTSTGTSSNPNAIAVSGRYAYVTSQTTNTFQVFDLGGTYSQSLEAGSAEFGSVNVGGQSTFTGDASFQGGVNVGTSLQVGGNFGTGGNARIQGTLSVAGGIQGGLVITGIAAPSAPTVTNVGTAGVTTYSYTVTAVSATGGESTASTAGTTATGNATLNTTNYNAITWTAVTGAVSYKVYRTVGGATQGLLVTTNSTYYYDQGAAGSGSAPTTNNTGDFVVQNAAGNQVLAVDTANNQVIVGKAGTTSGKIAFATAGGGSITLSPTSSASSFTLTLPAETGTICTTAASANCVNAIGGGLSGTFLAKNPTSTESSTSSINGFQYQMTNSNTGTSAGVLNLQGTSTTAFQIQNAAGSTTLLIADTANNVIRPGFGPTQASTSNTFTNVDTTGTVGQRTKTAIGTDGLPIIVYTDVTNSAIKVAKCSNATCSSSTKTTIASGLTAPSSGFLSGAIAVDPTGIPYVVYSKYSGANSDDILYIVRCGNAACSSGNSSPVAIHSTNTKGYQDIAIGSDGLPVISWGYASINVTKCGNTACNSGNTTTLSVATGLDHAIKLSSSDLPFISVYNHITGDLAVVSCGTTTCASGNTTTTIDNSSSIIGQYNSVAIPSDGKPVISYYDVTNANLRVAKCSNATCTSATKTTLDSTGTVGQYTSIVVGTSGQPIVSYYDGTNGDLKVYQCSNTSCTSGAAASIDTTNDVGQYTSIVLPSDGQPFISYYDNTSANLRTVKCSDASCSGAGTALSGVDLGNVSTQFRSVYFTTLNLNSGSSHLTLDESGNLVSNGLTAASDNTVVVSADSSAAFVVQSTAGTALLSANTTTGGLTIGTTTGTGAITIGQSTQNQTINIGTGAVASGKTLAIHIGDAGLAGSTINVTIGSAAAGGSLTVNSDATFNGTLKAAGHILSANASGTTTIALNANCGTGCTVSINGNDTAGLITVNTGTSPAAGAQLTVTFAVAYVSAPTIAITPNTVPASSNFPQYYYTSTTTTFDLNSYNALTASKTYTFSYHIIQR